MPTTKEQNSKPATKRRKEKTVNEAAASDEKLKPQSAQLAIRTVGTIKVRIEDLRYEIARKVRKKPDKKAIAKYAERWKEYFDAKKECVDAQKEGGQCVQKPDPPYPLPKVVKTALTDGSIVYDVVSGELRTCSAIEAGAKRLLAEVIEGSPEDVLLLAVRENREHGKPNTPADIECCVKSIKEIDPEKTCREIAKLVGSSKSTIARVLSHVGQDVAPDTKNKKEFDLVVFSETMSKRLEKNVELLDQNSIKYLVDHVGRIVQILDEKKLNVMFLDQLSERFWTSDDEIAKQ